MQQTGEALWRMIGGVSELLPPLLRRHVPHAAVFACIPLCVAPDATHSN
jgi:hypothetical protein